ncbi:MAG: hypothetical protein QNK37_20585 [Acidobacteriota bacterium]|nr:hypothetical protein [Acidobacteriota bacterium]
MDHKDSRAKVLQHLIELVDVVSRHLGERKTLEYFDAVLSPRKESLEDHAEAVLDEIIGAGRVEVTAFPLVVESGVPDNLKPGAPIDDGQMVSVYITARGFQGIPPAAETAVGVLMDKIKDLKIPGPVFFQGRRFQVARQIVWRSFKPKEVLTLTEEEVIEVPVYGGSHG